MTINGDIDTPPAVITARAGSWYRRTRYFISLFVVAYGIYSIYDGFYRYPRENAEWIAKEKQAAVERGADPEKVDTEKVPHPGWDVPFNQVFGVVLPPLGVILLLRWLYISRGEYRLENNTLHVPGHPPVPLDAVMEIDKRQWERKGIADIVYELADGKKGRLKLDDFIYERKPTDDIYDRIVAAVAPEIASTESAAPSEEQEMSSS